MSSVTDRTRKTLKVILSRGILQLNHPSIFTMPGGVACTCDPANLKAKSENEVISITVEGSSPSTGGSIVRLN